VATLGKNDMDDDKQTQKYNKKLTIVVLWYHTMALYTI
jgi:hypothetical protein